MNKFSYKMQNILNIKYKLEDQAKAAYAQANEVLNQERLKLQQCFDDIRLYESEIRKSNQNRLIIQELKRLKEALDYKKEMAKFQLVQVKAAEMNLELARKKLFDIMTERKTHEKLKEKSFEIFKQELNDEEKKEIDELVSFKYNKMG